MLMVSLAMINATRVHVVGNDNDRHFCHYHMHVMNQSRKASLFHVTTTISVSRTVPALHCTIYVTVSQGYVFPRDACFPHTHIPRDSFFSLVICVSPP